MGVLFKLKHVGSDIALREISMTDLVKEHDGMGAWVRSIKVTDFKGVII